MQLERDNWRDNLQNLLEVKWINPIIGYGTFALQNIEKETIIAEYTGIIQKF